jgi:hypothetical protein
MPIVTESTIRMDNRPGSLGRVCRALADGGVDIMAFQSIPSEKTILVCIVVEEQGAARAALDSEGIIYSEGEVVQVQLLHGPGELARVASKLGDANINIQYAYCGVEPNKNAPLVIFGVTELSRAARILDQAAAAAAGTLRPAARGPRLSMEQEMARRYSSSEKEQHRSNAGAHSRPF